MRLSRPTNSCGTEKDTLKLNALSICITHLLDFSYVFEISHFYGEQNPPLILEYGLRIFVSCNYEIQQIYV